MKKKERQVWQQVKAFLERNPGRYSYEGVAVRLGRGKKGARGIGSCMKKLGELGHHDLCEMVVKKSEL